MQVVATRTGYYGGKIREVGEVFSIGEGEKPGSWMEKADGKAAEPADKTEGDKPLSRMSKAELTAVAVEEGVDVTPDSMTNKEIIAAIEAARAGTADLL